MQKKLKKSMKKLLMILVFLVILSINNLQVLAQESTEFEKVKAELAEKISKESLAACRQALTPLFDIELKEFFEFIEMNFQNKSSNSSLTNIAIARYRDFKRNLNSYFAELNPSINAEQGTEAYRAAADAYVTCGRIKDEYFSMAKKMLIEHVKTTAAEKKASVMLDKYQALNSKLRDLNMEISQLYGYFVAFKEKLPGFLQKCVQL